MIRRNTLVLITFSVSELKKKKYLVGRYFVRKEIQIELISFSS